MTLSESAQFRRHSQTVVISSSIVQGLTISHCRTRSCSGSPAISQCPSNLATQLFATVNSKFKEMEDKDSSGFLRLVDDQVHESLESAKAVATGAKRLLHFHELPKERQENEYILSGYRYYKSYQSCLKSIFMLHNETLNIWSHLIGFVFFTYLSHCIFQRHFPEASLADQLVFMVFCLAALSCLFCSSVYHTFLCHSHQPIKVFAATLDYIGISGLITASVAVTEYYGFYCQQTAQSRYMLFTIIVGSIGFVMPFSKQWDTKACRPLRIAVFLAMGFSSVVPVIHLTLQNGFWDTMSFLHLAAKSVTMYLTGVVIYANRFPEKMFPGKFDFAGMTSHAIWHVFVCLGIFFHYFALLHFYDERFSYGCRFVSTE